jgi:hypothetical protein
MAEKRMYTKKITDSDAFIEMSAASQALYFHLNQCADDDGFNNQVQMAMWKAHASIDDLKVLMAKNFIIRFESGVIVIKHWRMHNTLRKDRYVPTNFQEELAMLGVKENEAYTLSGCQTVAKRLPQNSIEEISIEENSIDKDKSAKKRKVFTAPKYEEVLEYAKEKGREDIAKEFYDYFTVGEWVDSQGNKVRNWKQKFLTWCGKNAKKTDDKPAKPRYGTFDAKQAMEDALKRNFFDED